MTSWRRLLPKNLLQCESTDVHISTSSSWLAAALESKKNLLDGETVMATAATITAAASRANNHIYLVPVIKKFSVLSFDKSYKDFAVTHP
jgi:hypothetical protein